jgi:iron(III) transport system ATP-binding protein
MKIVSRSAAVKLDGVTKAFGNAVAVDSITLDIEAGTLVTLLGP